MRAVVVALALLCCVARAVPAADRCADGGDPRPDEGGIGGTGFRPHDPGDDDGIGGTGVIGTVTGFASICVAGVEVHYAADTPVQVDGVPATIADLAVGQVVEILADGTGDQLNAREIAIRHVVSGPVTGKGTDAIGVVGQRVELGDATRVEGDVTTGAYVEVSGMRRPDGVVVASRVTRVASRDTVSLTGPLAASGAATSIAGTTVELPAGTTAVAGEDVRVVGTWRDGAIRARSAEPVPRVPFAGRAARVEIEGFAQVSATGQVRVGPYVVTGAMPASAGRVRVEGRLRNDALIVDGIQPMTELPLRPVRPGGGGPGRSGPPPARPGRDAPPPDVGSGRGGPPPRPDVPGADRPAVPERPDRPDVPHVGRPPRPPERPPRVDRPPR